MKKNIIYFVTCLTFLLSSCGSKYKYWDISKFTIDNNALEDKEEIKLIYFSNGPDRNKNLRFYFHIIAISQRTGDTVNILTPVNNGFSPSDQNIIFNFFNQDNVAIGHMLDKSKTKGADKVVRDPEFDHIADNKYTTIIGMVGKLTE